MDTPMIRLPALILLLACLASPTSQAARSYDNCTGFVDSLPAVIGTQGTWCLRADLSTAIATGAAIQIAVNNVTLDCNDFKIGGLAAGSGTQAVGVLSDKRLNTTIRNCNIRGFFRGAHMTPPGAGHLIENNRFEANTWAGIQAWGENSTIRDNLVIDTGGSTYVTWSLVGMSVHGDGVSILDNTITGLQPTASSGTSVYGINTSGAVNVVRNRITGLPVNSGNAISGIYISLGRAAIVDNIIRGGASTTISQGIRCESSSAVARGNVVLGFTTPIVTCTLSGNLLN